MITISKKDGNILQIDGGNPEELSILRDQLTIKHPNASYISRKGGYRGWDGNIRLYNPNSRTLTWGLLWRFMRICKNAKIQFRLADEAIIPQNVISKEEIINYINTLGLPDNIKVRYYQLNAIYESLNGKRRIIECPTGSGKSLIIYILIRWFLDHKDGDLLLCVPRVGLVNQMYSDFKEYGLNDIDSHVARIGSKFKDKNPEQRVVISTWQSIFKQEKSFFKRFEMVIGDEAHTFTAKSLVSLMSKCVNTDIRIGLTGSSPTLKHLKLTVESVFGPLKVVETTENLIEKKYLNQCDSINMVFLKYPKNISSKIIKENYQDQIASIISDMKRNRQIVELANSLEGNTLIVCRRVKEHSDIIFEILEQLSDKKVYYIHGRINATKREEIRLAIQNEDNCILLASMGTLSMGINIPNLDNLILAHPVKSFTDVVQVIGRVLRVSDRKTSIYDFIDDFTINGEKKNRSKHYTINHALERYIIYRKRGFDVNFSNYQLYK